MMSACSLMRFTAHFDQALALSSDSSEAIMGPQSV